VFISKYGNIVKVSDDGGKYVYTKKYGNHYERND